MRLRQIHLTSFALGSVLAAGLVALPMTGRPAMAEDRERNPRIHKALSALREAKTELEEARNDFHGKKKDAQAAVDKAIDHLDEIKDW